MTDKQKEGSREDDRKLKQFCENALQITWEEMERNKKDKPELEKQRSEHPEEQKATD